MKFGRRYFGAQGGAKAWLIAEICREQLLQVVVCKDRRGAEELANDLEFFVGAERVLSFPAWDTLPFEPTSPQTDISAVRLRTLFAMAGAAVSAARDSAAGRIIVTSIDAILQRLLPRRLLLPMRFELARGQSWNRGTLLERLDACGFRRVSIVEEIGDMAVRGGVVDLFASTFSTPLRVEFAEDRIEELRLFDRDSQRSLAALEQAVVLPVREFVNFTSLPDAALLIPAALQKLRLRAEALETPLRETNTVADALERGATFPGIELMQAITHAPLENFFDYLSEEGRLILDDEIGMHQALDRTLGLLKEREERFAAQHFLIPAIEELYLPAEELLRLMKSQPANFIDHFEVFQGQTESRHAQKVRSFSNLELATQLRTKVGSGHALEPLRGHLDRWRAAGAQVAFVVGSSTRADRLYRLLMEIDIEAPRVDLTAEEWLQRRRPAVAILIGQLGAGFQLPDRSVVFVSESEIFAERSYRRQTQSQRSLKRMLGTLSQLKENDYLVHADYGVGIYRGLSHIDVEGSTGDFLQIDYADSKLYLPVQQIGKIQKFVAAEGERPNIDKLGSTRWARTKLRVRESVIALAGDLIKLYASRSVADGWRFEPRGAEDDRFADGFAFNETIDQIKAIEETLNDMAAPRPMDRLVCGDVGFGKTEVALRAAYKCTQHARQVAVLAPTTILVEQHRATFEERFAGYPVKIGALSRLYSAAENQQTLAALASGDLDIVVGTQRLLQRDVLFKDLGLLIVDEEHRFGVKQKERLKQFKTKVDVLSLTATPIPRTLHMSLLGIRDISVINTAPTDRRAIRTYVAGYNDTIVRDAILRELQRGGQCFFVHNRVQSIEAVAAGLAHLLPEARIRFAHGQMPEGELEEIMRRFINREFDVLVSTTIVESGIDIPNANTIIIDRADHFGLAQLYQLRGRVGRSRRQAYAYFLIPKVEALTEDAQKRLRVLQTLDDLGVGFNLALRDLEIRGAGNLLGKEQSGSVLAVGYELYSKILKEAVLNLKGDDLELHEVIDPEVKLGVSAYIPESYVPDISERLVMYQRLAALLSTQEADELRAEIIDRFGSPPPEVENLVELMRFRGLLRRYGVTKGELSGSRLLLSFNKRANVDSEKVIDLVRREPQRYRFSKNMTLAITLGGDSALDPIQLYSACEELLHSIQKTPPASLDATADIPA